MTFQEKLLRRLRKSFPKDEFTLSDKVEVIDNNWTVYFTIHTKSMPDYRLITGSIEFHNEDFTKGLLVIKLLANTANPDYKYTYFIAPDITPQVLDVIIYTVNWYS